MFRMTLAVLVILAVPAYSATFRVERDGSTAYTTIQAAVDAAASGDTIRIGRGRFDDVAVVPHGNDPLHVRVVVRQDALTFIGAGESETIIGPTTPWTVAAGWNMGIVGGAEWGNSRLTVSDIGFENMGRGVDCIVGLESVAISQCRFAGNDYSVLLTSDSRGSLEISDCTFDVLPRNGRHVSASGLLTIQVRDTEFNLDLDNIWHQDAVIINSATDAVFSGCSFRGGFIGLNLGLIGNAVVESCTFNNQTATVDRQWARAIDIGDCVLHISDTVFSNQSSALLSGNWSSVEIVNSRITDASQASIMFNNFASLVVHGCVLAKGSRYTIWQYSPCDDERAAKSLARLDLTNNDWGTTSADSIASWIRSCQYEVDYVPFVGQPVWTEPTSWGDLKASFR